MCPILLTRFPVKMRTLFQLDMWKTRPLKSFRVLHIADSNYELSGADRNILPVRHRVATIRIYRAGFPALQKFYVLFIGTKYFFAKLFAMEEEFYDVVILSDLHLGSEISRARDALQLLRSLRFHRLILLGDIFCNLDFGRLKKEHWRFLSFIRKLSNPKRGVEVVWVEGNHDHGLTNIMSHLVGVKVYQEYVWESSGKRHLAIHGHQFDRLALKNHILMNRLLGGLYLFIQKLSSKGVLVARFLDRMNTQWQRLTSKVAKGAISYARFRDASFVFCGHTHEPVILADNGVAYYNAGSWTNCRPSYITISGAEIKINEYIERINHHYPREERRNIAAPVADVAYETRLSTHVEYESIYS